MTRSEVQALVDQWLKAWNDHDPAALAALHALDGVVESPMFDTHRGRRAIEDVYRAFFTAFRETQAIVDAVVIDPPRFAVFATVHAIHVNEIFRLPATHKHAQFSLARLFETADGLITHERRIYDLTGFKVQLGALKVKS